MGTATVPLALPPSFLMDRSRITSLLTGKPGGEDLT